MSRVRSIQIDGETHWFETRGKKATHDQIELLATIQNVDLDDLLDENLTQNEVLHRLRNELGVNPIPIDVLERRREWRAQRQTQPACRICSRVGDSTRHHYINKWILKELSNYASKWADRSKNCIPLCIDCHRDIHDRSNGPVSIAEYLNDEERQFADEALSALAEERPKLLILIARGDDSVYEARLAKDWIEGKFRTEPAEDCIPHLSVVR
jgi:hypothetical protein